MPDTMIDIFDKGSALGNVFNKAVSSADGGNSVRAGEGAEPDGAEKFVPFQEILGQEMTKDASCSACPPQKSGKTVVTPDAAGTQKDALMIPLLTGDKLPSAKLQAGKEGIKGVKQQKGDEISGSVINEQILNGIFPMNMPLQLAAGAPSNPQTIEGESGLQMGDTITGNVANAASTLLTSTMGIPVGIGDEAGNGPSTVDNQSLLVTDGKGATVEGLNLSTSASAAFVKEATMGIAPRQGNAPSMVDNQTLLASAGNGVAVEGLNLSTSASAAFVKEATMEIVAGQGNEPSLVDNQTLLATAGKGIPVEGLNLSAAISAPFVKESVVGTNARPGNAPSLIEIRGRAFQGSNTGAVMSRMPGFYELPIQNTSQGGEQVFSMQTMLNALRMAEAAGVEVAPDAQGNAPVEMAATNALQMTKESNAVSGFSPEQDGVDAAAFKVAAQATPVSPSLTVHEQPAKELLLPNATDMQQGKHVYREDGASANAFGSQQDGGQESFEEQPEEPEVLDFASLETSTPKTLGDLSIMANTQPAKGPRSPNHLDLQHNAFVSHGNNTIQTSSVEGSDGVMSYLRNDKTDATGQAQTDVMDQLFQRISLATHGDRSEIKMYLTPPELGKVKIHFTEEHDEVKAKIFVENAEVKATIENNIHHLRESIASSGINIHKLEVYLQNEDTGKQKSLEDFNANNFGRQHQGQRHTGEGRNYFGEGKTDDKVVNRESVANASNYIIDYIS
ncbi:MAG TPA: flagellar hook-length control protein FliK [Candidatus Brocadiaceae bacterium]|nr:flagellar hook-length control protein FliK [Candidatus Brocadiaceae bacterium]